MINILHYNTTACSSPMFWFSMMNKPATTMTSTPHAISCEYCTRIFIKMFNISAAAKIIMMMK